MKNYRYSILAVSVSLWCLSGTAHAGGFGITVQSASGGGNAATGHAMAEDASAMWYNPALLSSVEGTQLNGGVSLLGADLQVTNTGSADPVGGMIGELGEVAKPGGVSATPSLFYKRDIGANKAFGLGVNIPFGVSTEYEKDEFARYEATESSLSTININPAMSWKINDKLALGAGLNFQYGQAVLAKSIDTYLGCSSIYTAGITRQLEAAGVAPAQAAQQATVRALSLCNGAAGTAYHNENSDNSVSVEASGFAFGGNVGASYTPTPNTRISVGYRSAVKYEMEGDADFDTSKGLDNIFDEATLSSAGLSDQDATADLELPASASLAFATKVTNKLTLHGDVTWTQWSSVPEIRIVFPDTAASDSVTSLEWEDTVRVGAGLTYQMNPKTKLRMGIAKDPTPTPDAQHRTPRAPRSDSMWFSVGVSHQVNKKLGIDASLAYVQPEDTNVDYTAPDPDTGEPTGYYTSADVEADAISAALSINYRFK